MFTDIKVVKYIGQELKGMLYISCVHIMTQEETTRVLFEEQSYIFLPFGRSKTLGVYPWKTFPLTITLYFDSNTFYP